MIINIWRKERNTYVLRHLETSSTIFIKYSHSYQTMWIVVVLYRGKMVMAIRYMVLRWMQKTRT